MSRLWCLEDFNSQLAGLLGEEAWRHLSDPRACGEVHAWQLPCPELPLALLDRFDLDALVMAAGGSWGGIRVAGRQLQALDWITSVTPTPSFIRRLLSEGHTIVINDLQEKLHPVFQLCQEMSARLLAGVNCNAYLTPVGAEGLEKHYDDEDVIVVQISGAKTWRLFPSASPLNPWPGMDYCQAHVDACDEVLTHVMRPGQALYIPRGVPHEAFCADESSLHFTFSIQGLSQADLLRELVDQMARDPDDPHRLRERVPPGWLLAGQVPASGRNALRVALLAMAENLSHAWLDRALAALLAGRCEGMASPLLRGCAELEADLGDASVLRRRATQALVQVPGLGKALFKGGSFDLDAQGAELVGQWSAGARVAVCDLPGEDEPSRLSLARQLIDFGLMERV